MANKSPKTPPKGYRPSSLAKCAAAHNMATNKLGTALGIAAIRAGFSSDFIGHLLGHRSRTLIMHWFMGRRVPPASLNNHIARLTRLLEIAADNGDVPDPAAKDIKAMHAKFIHLFRKYQGQVDREFGRV